MKKKTTYDIHSQRKVSMVNTEFNNNNKIIVRAISTNSRKLDIVAKEQFVMKGITFIDQIIIRRCYIEHNQSKKIVLLSPVVTWMVVMTEYFIQLLPWLYCALVSPL